MKDVMTALHLVFDAHGDGAKLFYGVLVANGGLTELRHRIE